MITRRRLLAAIPAAILVTWGRALGLENGRSVLGYHLDLSVLFNVLTLSMTGTVPQETARKVSRYRVTMNGKGVGISTGTEATGLIQDGRFKPLESRSFHVIRGRSNTSVTTYDYARQRAELHAAAYPLLLSRRPHLGAPH